MTRLTFRQWSQIVDFDPVYGMEAWRLVRHCALSQARQLRAQMDSVLFDAIAGGTGIMQGINRVDPARFYDHRKPH